MRHIWCRGAHSAKNAQCPATVSNRPAPPGDRTTNRTPDRVGGVGSYGRAGMPVVDDLLLVTQRDHRQVAQDCAGLYGGGVQLVPRARSPVMGPHWNAAQHSATASTRRKPAPHTHPTPGVRIHDRDARCPQQDSNLLLVTSPVTAGPTFRHLARAGIWNCRVASLHHAPHAGGLAVGVVRGPSHSTGKGRGGRRFPSHWATPGDSGLPSARRGSAPDHDDTLIHYRVFV